MDANFIVVGKLLTIQITINPVIKALETKLAQLQADYTKQDENEAKYQKAMEKWRKEIGKWAVANFAKAENIRTNYRNWNKTLNVDFDLPAGTTAERPGTPATGMMRYNTTESQYEVYDGSDWKYFAQTGYSYSVEFLVVAGGGGGAADLGGGGGAGG